MMEHLNFEQIFDILNSNLFEEFDCAPENFMFEGGYDSYTDISEEETSAEFIEQYKRLGKIKLIEQYGGEGQVDSYHTVYHFIDHDIYIKFDGYYQSYNGAEYSSMYQVYPTEVTKIEYLS